MKTHVRTNLRGGKLALLFATIFAVVMISVVGFCFTNANADNANNQDNAPAEFTIPVKNLVYELKDIMTIRWSDWVPEPDPSYVENYPSPEYMILDQEHSFDNQSYVFLNNSKEILILFHDTNAEGNSIYKLWSITIDFEENWYMVNNGNVTKLVPSADPYYLDPTHTYSFTFGKPHSFTINQGETSFDGITGFYSPIGRGEIAFEESLPHTFDLTCVANNGRAFFLPYASERFNLYIQFYTENGDMSYYSIRLNKDTKDKYEWLCNDQVVSIDPEHPTIFTFSDNEPTVFTLRQKPAPVPISDFTVKGQVVDSDGNPIPNAKVGFFNSDVDVDTDEPLITTLTDANGNFVLEGCYSGKDPEEYYLTYMAKHYESVDVWDSFEYDDIVDGVVTFDYPLELDPCMIDLYSDAPEHWWFTVTKSTKYEGEEPEIQYRKNLEYVGLNVGVANSDEPELGLFQVKDGGVLYYENPIKTESGATEVGIFEIVPHCDEAYKFANYLINDKSTYVVGDSIDLFNIIMEESHADVRINYASSAENNITQTGDASPFAVAGIAVIAAAAGAVFVLRRRGQQL